MACTSSASKSSYRVFLSFRGEDTRPGFTSHLAAALSGKHISTFIDDKLERGHEISPQLLKTIEESKISVVIFSEKYADSRWCLDELVKIMECKEAKGQIVLPIFYHVLPSDVTKQTGKFGEAFGIVKKKFKSNSDRVQRWSTALMEAANLSGWDSNNYGTESDLCKVVACHIKKLCPVSFTASPGLVGVNLVKEKIISDLRDGAPEVRSVGIWGIGGIGKTTVAEVVFAEISSEFDICCFFSDVRKKSENSDQVQVKKLFYSQLLGVNTLDIQSLQLLPIEILEKLCRKKAVVVLDDVSKSDQLKGLGVSEGWFGQGSRIIITSRDKQVLNSCVDQIHQIEGLNDGDAVELLKMKAFQKMDPEEGHMLLIGRVVNYCKGLPLAIKVLGSHLCQRTPKQWEIELDTLGKHPNPDIMDILKKSYDSLTPKQKDMFLDVACFFEGCDKDQVTPIFDASGFPSEQGLMRLVDKCLITINEYNRLKMHDLIEEMGRHVAQGQGSRLWDSKKICRSLRSNKGNEAVQIIDFNMNGIEKVQLHRKAFSGMPKLRILKFYSKKEQNIELIQQSDQANLVPLLPDNLTLLHWEYYPFKSLPSRLCVENLVELNLSHSDITQLWDGNQCPENLKILDLFFCRKLIRLPNLSLATKLIKVSLTACESLCEIGSWIKCLDNLAILNLACCEKLRSLPSMIKLKSLKTLDLLGCSSLKILPDIPRGIQNLELDGVGGEDWPLLICHLKNLHSFSMENCVNITRIPSNSVLSFNVVVRVEDDGHKVSMILFSGCENLQSVPMIKGNVRKIDLSGTGIQELPCLDGLSSLEHLDLSNCSKLVKLHSLDGLSSLEILSLCNCSSLVTLPPLDGWSSSLVLNLDDSSSLVTLPRLKDLRSLERLWFNGWSNLFRSPPLDSFSSLKRLSLYGWSKLIILPHLDCLSSLEFLYLYDCSYLVTLPPLDCLRSLLQLDLIHCSKLIMLPPLNGLSSLEFLCLIGCSNLVMLPPLNGLSRLRDLHLDGTALSEIPNDIDSLSSLEHLCLRNCKRLQCLPKLPKQLKRLNVAGCTCLTTVASTSYIPYPGSAQFACWEFNYVNCVTLDKEDRSAIMAGAQSLVKKLAVTNKELGRQLSYELGIPASEIPEWAMHKSQGSSIAIDFPPNCFDTENLLGFAFFAVVDCNPAADYLWDFCVDVNDSCKYYSCYDTRDAPQSDHLFVWYDDNVVDGNLGRVFEFTVHAWTEEGSLETEIKVKKCGVDLIYYDKRSTEVPSYCLEEPITTESISSESEVDSVENVEETVQLEADSEETPNSEGMKDFFSKLCSCFEFFT